MTSHDVVAIVRRTLHEKKVGHLGTLDPAATGLMVLAVGKKALKTIELFNKLPKTYQAELVFGVTSTTYDREGVLTNVQAKPGWPEPTWHDIQNTLTDNFIGKISQTPPVFSALHIDGERAYQKARRGETVTMPSREVEISKCDLLTYKFPTASIEVACGSGTYIRSIAHDLGQQLRWGAYLSALHRTTFGQWNIKNAVNLEELDWKHITPLKEILTCFQKIEVTPEQYINLQHGKDLAKQKDLVGPVIAWCEGLPVALLEEKAGLWHPRKVF
jgi:tRNA pseudouridine55 synthase